MAQIHYVVGDATNPPTEPKVAVIVHICNDYGLWGRGFVLALSRRFGPGLREAYQAWAREARVQGRSTLPLGHIQRCAAADRIHVVNMIAQHGIQRPGGTPPIRYTALHTALQTTATAYDVEDCDIHMPRIGCGLAGGDWALVEPLIQKTLVAYGFDVYVYDLPGVKSK